MPIQLLVAGIHHFQATSFRTQRELFEHLAQGQAPDTLFITCSDSRIDPNLITHTRPGDLFVLRNAGNIVPPYGAANGGEGPTIEFAVAGLKVRDIIVCGHSYCGAIKGLLNPGKLVDLPGVAAWLYHAEPTRRIIDDRYRHCSAEELLDATIEENVLVQLENLATHPCVAERLRNGELNLHAWVYDIETGEVYAYDPQREQFLPVAGVDLAGLDPRALRKPGEPIQAL